MRVSAIVGEPRRSQRTTAREHLAVLERRVEFLQGRAGEHRGGEGYDRAERAALEWALGVIRREQELRSEAHPGEQSH